MGKTRRSRKKYHLPPVSKPENDDSKMEISTEQPTPVPVPESTDFFSGQTIDMSRVKTSLDDDAKSTRSVAKTYRSIKRSLGGQSLTKSDKRNLRHQLFITRINDIYSRKEEKAPTIAELDSACPPVEMLFHADKKVKQGRPKSTKQKGIKKTKLRIKELNKNTERLKSLMMAAKPKSIKALEEVTATVEKKVLSEKI